jgi:diaminohydroxyphosphoribosylaminopyrimidine deaminase / 5-amino-6-(5-phosphoribosylamino)uracil reductase
MSLGEIKLNQIIKNPMQLALQLAEKGKYSVSPNPMVGAILIKNNKLIGYGYHLYQGDYHAESKAIDMAGINAKESSLYLNLEPCYHYGLTSPCVDKIIRSEIKEVHLSEIDPNPLVAGKSLEKLKNAGIKVYIGDHKQEAIELNEIFYHFMKYKRPFVIAKWAMTIDGKIATKNDSKWISCNESRDHVQDLRNSVDAILIGANTAKIDNPSLNVRKKGFAKERQPHKFILGKNLDSLSKDSNLFKYNPDKTHLINTDNNFDLIKLLEKMGEMGITSLLVEGGSFTLSKFLEKNLINKFYCYIAPKFIAGNDSISPFNQDIGINFIKDAKNVRFKDNRFIGNDILIEGTFRNK